VPATSNGAFKSVYCSTPAGRLEPSSHKTQYRTHMRGMDAAPTLLAPNYFALAMLLRTILG